MNSVISEFEDKVNEINEYFEFIKTTSHLGLLNEKQIRVSRTVYGVLKANMFLLLYNLIESSFKNALEKMCINITSDQLKYQEVIPAIKKLWIESQYKNFENLSIPRGSQKSEVIMQKIEDIANDIIRIEFYTNEQKTKNDDISGNVDAREIKRINQKYGAILEENSALDTQSLLKVKTKRNSLAHGDETFSKCGADYTIGDLEVIKDNSIGYMIFVLTRLTNFVTEKKYKLSSSIE